MKNSQSTQSLAQDSAAAGHVGANNPFSALSPHTVLVTGGTGFIGTELVILLLASGHSVAVLSRNPAKAQRQMAARVSADAMARWCAVDDLAQLDGAMSANAQPEWRGRSIDSVINLAGAPVIGPRWSAKRQAFLIASRVGTTQALLAWATRAQFKPSVWLQASAIGFYGVRPAAEALSETSARGQGFMADLCVQWERAASPVLGLGIRLVTMRLGVVLGHGGALPPLLLPFRLGLGGRMGDGQQIMSWIHLADLLAFMAQAIGNAALQGTYNLVAPQAPSQAEFAATAGRVLRRPVWFHVPAAPIRWVGGEMAQIFVDGQNVVPARLIAQGHTFRFSTIESALCDLAT